MRERGWVSREGGRERERNVVCLCVFLSVFSLIVVLQLVVLLKTQDVDGFHYNNTCLIHINCDEQVTGSMYSL